MAIALVGSSGITQSGGSPATTTAINSTGGNLLIVGNGYFVTGATDTDSKSNSYTMLMEKLTGSAAARLGYSGGTPTVGASHTFTSTQSTGLINVIGSAWSGLSATPFGAEDGNLAASGGGELSITAGATGVTPSLDGCLVVTGILYAFSASETFTIDSGFTILDQHVYTGGTAFGYAFAYKILGAGTSGVLVNPTWSWTPDANGAGVATNLAYFKPVSSVGPATKLAITAQPTTSLSGRTYSPAIEVTVQDASGNTVTTDSSNVTLALTATSLTAYPFGTLTVAASSGVATFTDVYVLAEDGATYNYTATDGVLTSATTTDITNTVESNDCAVTSS